MPNTSLTQTTLRRAIEPLCCGLLIGLVGGLLGGCGDEASTENGSPSPDAADGTLGPEDAGLPGDVSSDLSADVDEELGPAYTSAVYSDLSKWFCHPEVADDYCSLNLDYTEVEADGSTSVVTHVTADAPTFDCFYVYPTASDDSGSLSE